MMQNLTFSVYFSITGKVPLDQLEGITTNQADPHLDAEHFERRLSWHQPHREWSICSLSRRSFWSKRNSIFYREQCRCLDHPKHSIPKPMNWTPSASTVCERRPTRWWFFQCLVVRRTANAAAGFDRWTSRLEWESVRSLNWMTDWTTYSWRWFLRARLALPIALDGIFQPFGM